jgi:large subunit ribosomal protein L13
MKSYRANNNDPKKYIVVDIALMKKQSVDGKIILGRICSGIASILRGKHKRSFTPGVNCGDIVVVLNSDLIDVTGKKMTDKIHYQHTGYTGSLYGTALKDRLAKDSREVIRVAVKRMLPSGCLGRAQLKLLKVFKDANHQMPVKLHTITESMGRYEWTK